jgi:hypothetical protein
VFARCPISALREIARHASTGTHRKPTSSQQSRNGTLANIAGFQARALTEGKGRIDLAARAGFENFNLRPDGAGGFLHAPRCRVAAASARRNVAVSRLVAVEQRPSLFIQFGSSCLGEKFLVLILGAALVRN